MLHNANGGAYGLWHLWNKLTKYRNILNSYECFSLPEKRLEQPLDDFTIFFFFFFHSSLRCGAELWQQISAVFDGGNWTGKQTRRGETSASASAASPHESPSGNLDPIRILSPAIRAITVGLRARCGNEAEEKRGGRRLWLPQLVFSGSSHK